MDIQFEHIQPWNGKADTGRDARLKLQRNFEKIAQALKEIGELNTDKYLRKDIEDVAQEIITFLKGLKIGNNGSGITVLPDGTSQAVVDRLYVRIKAIFDEIEVKKATHVGGEQMLTPAGMKCVRVEELADVYRCYFNAELDGVEIVNEFTPGTLAIGKETNIKEGTSQNVATIFFWRQVTAVGKDYIDLSKTDCAKDSDAPKAGDDIVGLGHKTDITRQAAIVLSSVNEVSPSITFYQGINDYSLAGKEVISLGFDKSTGHAFMQVYGEFYVGERDQSSYIRFSPKKGVEVKGTFHIQPGSTGWRDLDGLPDEIKAAVDKANQYADNIGIGAINLLRNSGFAGDYESESLNADTQMDPDLEMYSKHLKHWSGIATVSADQSVPSGYVAAVGSLSQPVQLISGEKYVISYLAKGTQLVVSCGNFSVSQTLTGGFTRYIHKFTYDGTGVFSIGGSASVHSIQLERGTVATDWSPSPFDTDKAAAKYMAVDYISSAIKDGSVDILGGLILASMLQLGNYKEGKMQEVTAGVSGVYNDGDDVAFWAGGTLEKAIRTVMEFKSNPGYKPTDSDWQQMANFVATHGGDLFMRGYIYALGGMFRGTVFAEDGEFNGTVNLKSRSGRITLSPEDEYGLPSIDIYDRNGEHLAFISLGVGVTGAEEPRVALFSKDGKRELNLYTNIVKIEETPRNGKNYRTELTAGGISMWENDVCKWEKTITT